MRTFSGVFFLCIMAAVLMVSACNPCHAGAFGKNNQPVPQ
jgi:hypothetical protein